LWQLSLQRRGPCLGHQVQLWGVQGQRTAGPTAATTNCRTGEPQMGNCCFLGMSCSYAGASFLDQVIYEVLSILQCVSSGVLVYLSVCRSASGPLSVDWDAAELCLDLLLVSGRQQQGGTQRQQHASLLQQTSAVCSLASSATSRGSYVRVWLVSLPNLLAGPPVNPFPSPGPLLLQSTASQLWVAEKKLLVSCAGGAAA
jgi:hypothetical protein